MATAVSRPAKIEPTEAASDSREAVLTVSPTTVYASAAWTPASTSPVLSPTRSPSRRPPPSSSATSRLTSCCMLTAARTARSASSSWAVGAPNTAMMPSPVSLSTWPPTSTTTLASAAEHPVGHFADPLGIEVLGPGGEVGEVAEQHGDDPALGGLVDPLRSVSGMPQTWQKRAPATVGVEQVGQRNGPVDMGGPVAKPSGGGEVITISRGARWCPRGWPRPCGQPFRWPGWG